MLKPPPTPSEETGAPGSFDLYEPLRRGTTMPCLLILLALAAPRLALVVAWLFTDVINRAYDNLLLPLLGLVFLPLTTLAYGLVWVPGGRVEGWDWAWIALAVLIDLSQSGATRRRGQER